jgi:DNA sulfur modification protein DndC
MAGQAASKNENSAFAEHGMVRAVKEICDEIRELYQWDQIPWVVGYSGGKDSSAVLQLIWLALSELPAEQRIKPVHVISTDTLVEQPMVAAWVDASHAKMRKAAEEQGLPVTPHKLTPAVQDAFWVNLIGKGYPAPRHSFRWCTSRMKINPSNNFIRSVIRENGEALLVLGTRKAESQLRGRQMASQEKQSRRAFLNERLTLNSNLPNSRIYTPIEAWTNDDVWLFLMQMKNPWGHTNKSLLGMYQGASTDGECPLVVDSTTPSCGNSRFGCWVCTVVDKDRSMEAMIKNDDEKVWMTPLLELRNELGDFSQETSRRDYRRMSGRVDLFGKDEDNLAIIRGPYTKKAREFWLRRVLETQTQVRQLGPEEFRDLELISMPELQEIRNLWLYEKHEFDDSLPVIFEEVTGQPFPKPTLDDNPLGAADWQLLREVCGDDEEFFELQASLLDIERAFCGMTRRAGIYEKLEDRLKAGQFENEQAALQIRRDEERRRREAEEIESASTLVQISGVQRSLFEQCDSEGTE